MEEETERAQETETQVTESSVTDEQLSALETKQQADVTEPQTLAKPIDSEEHKESTRLGRKVVKLEDNVNRLVGTMEQFINEQRLAQMSRPPQNQEPDETIVTSSKDVETIIERREQLKRQQTEKYQLGYYHAMREMGMKDPSLYSDIEKEMTKDGSPFNAIHTGNPQHDALINYSQAKASVMAKMASATMVRPKVPVAGEPPESPTALATSTRVKPPEISMPKLTPEAQKLADYCKSMGMTDKEIKEALSAETPIDTPPLIGVK